MTGEAGLLAAAGSADLSEAGSIAAAVAGARTAIGNATAAAWQEFLQITDVATLEADPQATADAYAYTAFQAAQAVATPAAPALPAVPVERRPPPDGYRRAIEAHRQAAPPSPVGSGIAEAVERQTMAMRELSHRTFPEPDVAPGGAPAPIEQARLQRRRQADASHAAALRRARAERAAKDAEAIVAASVPQSAPLGRTA
ncbi:DUF721 domain-containing protein [Streptomyces laurentii]|uniref:DUF721 domain-containing protein n=1 Tax=Streptomyces laurentii TaxID=39478 RepID=UPI0036BB7542